MYINKPNVQINKNQTNKQNHKLQIQKQEKISRRAFCFLNTLREKKKSDDVI